MNDRVALMQAWRPDQAAGWYGTSRCLYTVVVSLGLMACSGDGGSTAATASGVTLVDTIGDTVVVANVGWHTRPYHSLVEELEIGESGSRDDEEFGRITELAVAPDRSLYVFDGMARRLSKFDAEGKFAGLVGARGRGPGEYLATSGLATTADGSVVLWDPEEGRISTFSSAGKFIRAFNAPRYFHTTGGVSVDNGGRIYTRVEVSTAPGFSGLIQYDSSGALLDSLRAPQLTGPSAVLRASGPGTVRMQTPYTPRTQWAWHPRGHFAVGVDSVYQVDVRLDDVRVLRITLDTPPVPTSSAERTQATEFVTATMRSVDPRWTWTGPPVPQVKPYYRAFTIAPDGRLWVLASVPGERIAPDDPRMAAFKDQTASDPGERLGETMVDPKATRSSNAPSKGSRVSLVTWLEPDVYDVFDAGGAYLARVKVPPRVTLKVMLGDNVWGVKTDSLDVQSVVRYRIAPSLTAAAASPPSSAQGARP